MEKPGLKRGKQLNHPERYANEKATEFLTLQLVKRPAVCLTSNNTPTKTKPPENNLLVQRNLILRPRYQRKAEISCKQGPEN
jgi:hypothetical protein